MLLCLFITDNWLPLFVAGSCLTCSQSPFAPVTGSQSQLAAGRCCPEEGFFSQPAESVALEKSTSVGQQRMLGNLGDQGSLNFQAVSHSATNYIFIIYYYISQHLPYL